MVHRQATLVLPLMHHLVEQRLDCLAPAMSPYVTAADRDLRALARWIAVSVMSEPALHSTRHPYWNPGKRPAEPLAIQLFAGAPELFSHRLIIGMSSFPGAPLSRRRLELERKLRVIAYANHPASSTAESEEKP